MPSRDIKDVKMNMEILRNIDAQSKKKDDLGSDLFVGSVCTSIIWVSVFLLTVSVNLQLLTWLSLGADLKSSLLVFLCSIPCLIYAFLACKDLLFLVYATYFYKRAVRVFALTKEYGMVVEGKILYIYKDNYGMHNIVYQFISEAGKPVEAKYSVRKEPKYKAGDNVPVIV